MNKRFQSNPSQTELARVEIPSDSKEDSTHKVTYISQLIAQTLLSHGIDDSPVLSSPAQPEVDKTVVRIGTNFALSKEQRQMLMEEVIAVNKTHIEGIEHAKTALGADSPQAQVAEDKQIALEISPEEVITIR